MERQALVKIVIRGVVRAGDKGPDAEGSSGQVDGLPTHTAEFSIPEAQAAMRCPLCHFLRQCWKILSEIQLLQSSHGVF